MRVSDHFNVMPTSSNNLTSHKGIKIAIIDSIRFPWLPIFVTLLVSLIPLILSDFIYMDDMGRVNWGYADWDHSWRYLSNFLSYFLYSDSYLADISPIPQILAVAIIAIAATILIKLFCPDNDRKISIIAAVIPLALSPYFLQCLSYKYDAPYMALSVLFSVIPFLYFFKSKKAFLPLVFLGCLGMCLTYQASSGIFFMVLALLIAKALHEGIRPRDLLITACAAILVFIVALAFFQFVIAQPPRAGSIDTGIPPLIELPSTYISNLINYYKHVIVDARLSWLILYFLCFATFFFAYTFTSQKNSRLKSTIIAIVVICVMSFACFGVYPLLKGPLFSPRGMLAFGVFLTLINLYSCYLISKPILRGASILLACAFISFTLIYGNALEDQKEYTQFRVEMVANALNEEGLLSGEQVRRVKITGDIGMSPVIEHMPNDYTALRRLIHPTFSGSYIWGSYLLLNYYGINNLQLDETVEMASLDLPTIRSTYYYDIKANEDYVWIILKDGA